MWLGDVWGDRRRGHKDGGLRSRSPGPDAQGFELDPGGEGHMGPPIRGT